MTHNANMLNLAKTERNKEVVFDKTERNKDVVFDKTERNKSVLN